MLADTKSAAPDAPAEDDDKGGKLRRRRQSQARSFAACLALLGFLVLVVMVKMNHNKNYTPSKLRRHRGLYQQHDTTALEGKSVGETVDSFLPPDSIYKLSVHDMAGNLISLAQYSGMFQSRGFSVLAFPISNFHQELASNDKIQEFVTKEYPQANFPIFGLSTLEDNVVYQQLQSSGNRVRWNFFKYLVDRNGKVVQFYDKRQDPSTLTTDIENLLDASNPDQHKLVTK